MSDEILKDILAEVKGMKVEIIEIKKTQQKMEISQQRMEILQQRMEKDIKDIKMVVEKGIYFDFHRLEARVAKLEEKIV